MEIQTINKTRAEVKEIEDATLEQIKEEIKNIYKEIFDYAPKTNDIMVGSISEDTANIYIRDTKKAIDEPTENDFVYEYYNVSSKEHIIRVDGLTNKYGIFDIQKMLKKCLENEGVKKIGSPLNKIYYVKDYFEIQTE